MGKGSKPRSNHSVKWFANYDDIDWSPSPRIMELNDEQLDCFYAAREELQGRGIDLTRDDENEIVEAIKKDIK